MRPLSTGFGSDGASTRHRGPRGRAWRRKPSPSGDGVVTEIVLDAGAAAGGDLTSHQMVMDTVTRAKMIVAQAWSLLPRACLAGAVTKIRLQDLGAVHGQYDPDTGVLTLNPMLYDGRQIDDAGGADPLRGPRVSRALHTTLHEFSHALGDATGLDRRPAWLVLSGWVKDEQDASGYGRYWERRPGWDYGPSPWRYRHGSWFCREYSSKTPYEDFADVVTYRALGWTHVFGQSGRPKLWYVNRHVWREPDEAEQE